MQHIVVSGREARAKLLEGVNALDQVVGSTLGPNGQNVMVNREVLENGGRNYYPYTKDGVSIASIMGIDDPIATIGLNAAKSASLSAVKEAGDGTTTATVLLAEIVRRAFALIDEGKARKVDLVKGIKRAVADVVEHVKSHSRPVTQEDYVNVATIAANNDPEMGAIVAKAVELSGQHGIISVGDSLTGETVVESVDGLRFDGRLGDYRMVNNYNQGTFEAEKPLVFLSTKSIQTVNEIDGMFKAYQAIPGQRPLVIVSREFGSEVVATVMNSFMASQSPFYRKVVLVKMEINYRDRDNAIADVQSVIGGMVYLEEAVGSDARTFTDGFKPEYFGTCEKVVVAPGHTTFIGGAFDKEGAEKEKMAEARETRIKELVEYTENPDNESDAYAKTRLARLTGGIVTIKVHAPNEEMRGETKDRYDDAIRSTLCAIEEGVVPGGGIALLRASQCHWRKDNEDLGYALLIDSLLAPFNRILTNGEDDPENIHNDLIDEDYQFGYNPLTGEVIDFYEAGIIDPAKVVRTSLKCAADAACVLIASDNLLYKKTVSLQG